MKEDDDPSYRGLWVYFELVCRMGAMRSRHRIKRQAPFAGGRFMREVRMSVLCGGGEVGLFREMNTGSNIELVSHYNNNMSRTILIFVLHDSYLLNFVSCHLFSTFLS